MNIYTLNNKQVISNIYINISFIKDTYKLFTSAENKIIATNITNIKTFLNELVDYENTHNNGRNKETSINYGVCLTMLLDKQHTPKELKELTKEIANKYNNLPYFSYLTNKGKGYYLNIYLSERYYNPGGIKKESKASKNIYKDRTGKLCTKNKKGAILYKKKGETIKSKIEFFSSKTRYFRFNNKGTFIKALSEFKVWYAKVCEKVLNTIINTTISFKKYVLKILSYKEKNKARLWNNALTKMEADFNKAYISLTINGTEELNNDIKSKLDNLYISTNRQIINNYAYYQNKTKDLHKFKSGKYKFYIDFNKHYNQNKTDSKELINLFNKRLTKIYESAF